MHFPKRKIYQAAIVVVIALAATASVVSLVRPVGAANPQQDERPIENVNFPAPVAGDPAPDFTLGLLGEDATVTLGDYAGKQDVVLIFGSYT